MTNMATINIMLLIKIQLIIFLHKLFSMTG